MTNILWIALGATIGSLLRYASQEIFSAYLGAAAIGTFLANSLGCLAAGFVAAFFDQLLDGQRLFLMAGVLGSLTTLSSLQIEVLQYLQSGKYLQAGTHWVLGSVFGLAFCWLGFLLGQK